MITEFESVLKDESAHIAKYKRTSVLIKVVGIAFLLVGLAIASTPWNWPTAAAALLAVAGGFLAGVSLAYDHSLKSWPNIRTLLKDNALEILKSKGEARDG
jgi:drug/metabolite transporter (DMT)-like permease